MEIDVSSPGQWAGDTAGEAEAERASEEGRGRRQRGGQPFPGLVGSPRPGQKSRKAHPGKKSDADEAKGGWAGSYGQQGVHHLHWALLFRVPAVTGGEGQDCGTPPPPGPRNLASSCEADSIPLPDALVHLGRAQAGQEKAVGFA